MNLVKRYKPRDLKQKNKSRLDVYDGRNKNYRISLEECEEWSLMPASVENPEEYLVAKGLYLLACSQFSPVDMMVLSNSKSIRDVVVENGWNYDSYKKQLQRQRKNFVSVASSHGYEYFN